MDTTANLGRRRRYAELELRKRSSAPTVPTSGSNQELLFPTPEVSTIFGKMPGMDIENYFTGVEVNGRCARCRKDSNILGLEL